MRNLLSILLFTIICSCNEIDMTAKVNLSGSFDALKIQGNPAIGIDTAYLPTYGNGIKHFQPQASFMTNFALFQSLLQHFKYEALPFDLDTFEVDKTDKDWGNKIALSTKYFAYLIDESAFFTINEVINPREKLTDFYQIYPIAKFNETELFHTLLYVVRYLDGNGQQDIFYLTTFSNEGLLLSGVEIGALEASVETYMKTAEIKSESYIKVYCSNYDEKIKDWVKERESEYYLDRTGQVYANYENIKEGVINGKNTIENKLSKNKTIEFSTYFELFKKELQNNSAEGLLKYITFPHFRVSYEEHFQDFYSAEEFIAQYPIIFNEEFRKSIIRQNMNDLIVNNNEIGLSDGSIWFKRIGRDNDGKLVVAIRVN